MAEANVHHLLLTQYVGDMLERRGPYRDAHLAKIRAARDEGHVVMAGALGDPPSGGAIAFRGLSPEEIEAFVRSDPYFEAGLLVSWRIERWNLV